VDVGFPSLLPATRPPKLLHQVKRCIRDKRYSLRTEETYVYWIRYVIRYSGLRHPIEMGATEVKAFLSCLTNERQVSVSTHKQALCALRCLYKQVLVLDFTSLDDVYRPNRPPRLATVPTKMGGGRRTRGAEGNAGADGPSVVRDRHAVDGRLHAAGEGCRLWPARDRYQGATRNGLLSTKSRRFQLIASQALQP
jgi:hypothetical protein